MGLARPPAETVKEHWTILTALRKHDPDASEAAMRLHLRRSRERLDRLRASSDCAVHTGDPSIYGAIGEQMDALDRLGIEYEVVPGISSRLLQPIRNADSSALL